MNAQPVRVLQALAEELNYDTTGETKEELVADILDGQAAAIEAESDDDESGLLTQTELNALTIAKIKALAKEKGYTITQTTKANIITEFLAAQTAAVEEAADADESGDYSQTELEALTVEAILLIAEDKGYTITETEKAAIITEFLAAQEEAASDDDT